MAKSYKKPYTKSKRFDKTCRNHGSCSWCYNNRMHKSLKKIYPMHYELMEHEDRYEDVDTPIEDLLNEKDELY
jgi:hypothetical protein